MRKLFPFFLPMQNNNTENNTDAINNIIPIQYDNKAIIQIEFGTDDKV